MIDDKLISQINIALSKEPKIKLAYILGSVISGRAKTGSDFDLAVVDKSSSPLFLFQIISTGQCIYQRSQEKRVSFEAYTLKNYYDTAHLRKIYYLKDKFSYAN